MKTYWILPHPGANAVFFEAAEALSQAELTLCAARLQTRCASVRTVQRAGCRWLVFDAEDTLTEADLRRLCRLSSLYALFMEEGGLLLPVEPLRSAAFGEDLSGILKYTGKTNALFTRVMLHIAELSLPGGAPEKLRLLDPVAGKGTTLFEALMRGWDAAGIEIVQRAAHEGAVYFQKYLETEKWRHKLREEKFYGAQGWRFAFARDKDELKNAPGELLLIAGDAKNADRYLGKACFDIVAGDLPYGVAHGSIAGSDLMRSPAALLTACLPAWRAVLRPGGVLALSWNTLVMPRAALEALLCQNGLSPQGGAPYDALSHRVDASIQRDIAVAVRA